MQPHRNQPGQRDPERLVLGGPPLFVATGPCSNFLLLAGARWRRTPGQGSEAHYRNPRLMASGQPVAVGGVDGVIRSRSGAGWRHEYRSG